MAPIYIYYELYVALWYCCRGFSVRCKYQKTFPTFEMYYLGVFIFVCCIFGMLTECVGGGGRLGGFVEWGDKYERFENAHAINGYA